jgi:hypothetical protein
MKILTGRFVFGLTLLLLVASATCYGQFTASVQGIVQDSKDAVVPNATVTVINTDTGVRQEAVSNASGVYRFSSLAPVN